ncbi:uncharacterized protein LOC128864965 [Anastrepha ludens]|uniref:uncharacterized protein LOC128864965 n=1 Tax=Anastrepha ludens TaxID=28586 RepID=UPI0023AF692A|nr:uncharacterized protein LOC128864965 [Anastrepha ludens]XP_053960758.1 uncharacterized protein LOC128864965 [Anastrepha ludens]XP_053960759.1 uncharacterized protein LOC128864965 [Anastrepha ludens]
MPSEMTDSIKLSEMQRSSIEFERQRHLANWFIKSSPHMATPTTVATVATTTTTASSAAAAAAAGATTDNTTASNAVCATTKNTTVSTTNLVGGNHTNGMSASAASHHHQQQLSAKHHNSCGGGGGAGGSSGNPPPVFFLVSSNGNTNGNIVNGKHSSNASPAATGVATPPNAISAVSGGPLGHFAPVEGRKPKLRRFNSHDTSANMFSVADFENARLARRNEIEMKQRLARRMRMSANGGYACSAGGMGANLASGSGVGGSGCGLGASGNGMGVGTGGSSMCGGGDYSTGDSKASKYSNESQHEPLPADIFLDRYSLPRVVRISYKTKFSDETLQSSSSNGSSTATTNTTGTSASNSSVSACGLTVAINTGTSSSTASSSGNVNAHSSGATNTSSSGGGGGVGGGGGSSGERVGSKHSTPHNTTPPSASATATQSNTTINGNSNADAEQREDHGELFLLYRLIRQRHIFHGHNAKTAAASRKKGVLIPQEFPGYFSLLNDKGIPTATLYTSLIQLVRERVYKFVSVDNMPAFTESQPNVNNPPTEGCIPIYSQPPPPPTNNRPQYVKTTARGGQVFRLLAVFEDGKQDHATIGCTGGVTAKAYNNHGREKEKGRYAQLLNENRQVLYVSLSTKGKFYEIEPGIPQILQKLGGIGNEANKKVNPDCVHRITALITPQRELPLTLRYISGPNGCNSAIPDNVCITHITTENVVIACPIEDVEVQSPLHLRKLHLSKEMNLLKSSLGFESEQRMLANPNVQNILKFCQFNCDQFLKMVEVEILHRPERSGSKSRGEGLKILKPLHLPKLLRREKTTIPAHEKEDSIIFLSKSDLANLEAKEAAAQAAFESATSSANRITEKMKVFQSTKKKWFRKQDKHVAHTMTSYELDVQAKRMSMERYSDMSKLLQERFGDKPNTQTHDVHESFSEPSGGASDIGCSDTETTTLATIDEKLKKVETRGKKLMTKSMSLQDIELISGGAASRKPDLLPNDTISEAGTDVEDLENQDPIPQSFITEKLYNEFHVKTRQYSKSSSSLHQLLNFSLPQKMQLHDNKRSMAQLKHNTNNGVVAKPTATDRRLDFNIGEPVTGRRAAGGLSLLAGNAGVANSLGILGNHSALASPLTPTSLIDDLPYSSVRDSLVLSSDESASDNPTGNICQALNLIDYNKENIYAEICHDNVSHNAAGSSTSAAAAGTTVSAMGGICTSATRETFSNETHSTQISDDYGDYASLTYTAIECPTPALSGNNVAGALSKSASGQTVASDRSAPTGLAISRVQINCNAVSPVSYHTVYLGEEPLSGGEKQIGRAARRNKVGSKSRAHITTVALEGNTTAYEAHNGGSGGGGSISTTAASIANELEEVADNIYNTLK